MDGNKDEALKCLRIGKEALNRGDAARAMKFLSKAQRLDPTLQLEDLIAEAGNNDSQSTDFSVPDNQQEASTSSHEQKEKSSIRARTSIARSSSSSSSKAYTEEQLIVVRQIKKQKDYYSILGLERNCSVDDVRKAYRKLSLKVHPDKNKAPGAEEAFKAVSKAFQCLSNEESRKRYDLMGSEDVVYDRPTSRHGANAYNGFYSTDVDAEEIFRNFFFGGMSPVTTGFGGFRFRTGMGPGVRATESQPMSSNMRTLLQLLPVFLLLLLNFLPSNDPVYSLSRSYPYEHRFVSQKGVPFFVKNPKFEQDYPHQSSKRIELESHMEREYFARLSENCGIELQRRRWGLAHQTPHCDLLKQYGIHA